jgi:hypothetical protein
MLPNATKYLGLGEISFGMIYAMEKGYVWDLECEESTAQGH